MDSEDVVVLLKQMQEDLSVIKKRLGIRRTVIGIVGLLLLAAFVFFLPWWARPPQAEEKPPVQTQSAPAEPAENSDQEQKEYTPPDGAVLQWEDAAEERQ